MKIFKEKGSKDRLVEMMQNVNKVKLNEVFGSAYDPQNVLAMAFDDLKNKRLNIKHTSTQAENDVSYVELIAVDKNGDDITFTFKAIVNEGDQEGVFDIADIGLESFTFDPTDGGESVEISGDMLKKFNLQHKNEMLDVVKEYMDVNDEASEMEDGLTEFSKVYEDAVRLIDSMPFKGGSEKMVTHKQYADQKPTNDALRVKAPELEKFVNETTYSPETRKNVINYFANIWSKSPLLRTNPKFVEALGKYFTYTLDDFNKLSDDELQYIWDKSDEISNLNEEFGPEEKNLMNKELSRFRNVIKPKDAVELQPEEPAGDVPEEKKQMILTAYDNIVKRSGNPNYAPTTQEIQAELKKTSRIAPEPPKRTFPAMAEPFLENYKLGNTADTVFNMQQSNLSPESKEMLIKMAGNKIDNELGVKKFQMPKQEYYKLVKEEAMKLMLFGLAKMNEDENDYPKEMGKEFSPEKQYNKKKIKYSKKIKLKEDDDENQIPQEEPSSEQNDDEIAQLAQEKEKAGDLIQGGKADEDSPLDFDLDQLKMGVDVEMEHTDNPLMAFEIAMDHLAEFPDYYTRLKAMEDNAKKERDDKTSNSDDKEETDALLGFKPMNVGDGMEDEPEPEQNKEPKPEEEKVDESTPDVSSEDDLKQTDPATWHQIQIAKKTIKMPDAMANVMGGMTKDQAREILRKRGMKFNEGSYDTPSIEENDDPYEKFKKYQEKDVKGLRDDEKEEYFNLWQQFKDVK